MADMNKEVNAAPTAQPPRGRGDRAKATLSFVFGLIAVNLGGLTLLIALVALLVKEGTWVLINTFSIAGIVLSSMGMIFGGKVSAQADQALRRKAATGKTLSVIGLIVNIIATIVMFVCIAMLFSLIASGDYNFDFGW